MDDDEAFERLGDVMARVVGDVWQMADAALKADDEQRMSLYETANRLAISSLRREVRFR